MVGYAFVISVSRVAQLVSYQARAPRVEHPSLLDIMKRSYLAIFFLDVWLYRVLRLYSIVWQTRA